MVNYSGFDPLVANGILPASARDIITYNIPLPSQIRYNPVNTSGRDSFIPSQNKNKGFSWGKWILGSMAATAAILGIRKYGVKGISKAIGQGFEYVKNHLPKIFTKKP